MAKTTISLNSFIGGMNTVDDPHTLQKGEVQLLINALPGEAPRMRSGTSGFNNYVAPDEERVYDWPSVPVRLFAWRDDVQGHVVLAQLADGLWFNKGKGHRPEQVSYSADLMASESKPLHAERVMDSMIFVGQSCSFVVERSERGFTARASRIERPNIEAPEGMLWSETNKGDYSVEFVPAPDNGLLGEHYYQYAFTFVNRQDTEEDADTYNAGLLESIDDLDERLMIETPAGQKFVTTISFSLSTGDIDRQVTHLNVYRTQGVDKDTEGAFDIARGMIPKFVKSISLKEFTSGTLDVVDSLSDSFLGGETHTIEHQVGVDPIPPGCALKYHNGRLWVGGLNSGDQRGRWYYSVNIVDTLNPVKYLCGFNYINNFFDTSLDNSDRNMAAVVSGNDLYLLMEQSVWRVMDGNVDNAPDLISTSMGTRFPNSPAEYAGGVFYLSNSGPAYLRGGSIEPVSSFKSGRVWPSTWQGAGKFFRLGLAGDYANASAEDVLGFFCNGNYFLCYMDDVEVLHLSASQGSSAAWRLEFASKRHRIGSVAVFDSATVLFSAKPDTHYDRGYEDGQCNLSTWRLLDASVSTDDMAVYKFKMKSGAIYTNKYNRALTGEVYDLRVMTMFTDGGALRMQIASDFYRHIHDFTYEQRPTSHPQQNQQIHNRWRNMLQQGVQEGLYGHFFEVSVEKNYFPPYDFVFHGFDMRLIMRPSQPMEYVSLDNGGIIDMLDKGYLGIAKYIELEEGIGYWSVEDTFTVQGTVANPLNSLSEG